MQNILTERIGIASLFLLAVFSFFGWYAFFNDTITSYVGGTISMLLGFSFAGIFFFIGAILWQNRLEMLLGGLLPFVPLLLFTQVWYVALAVCIAFLVTLVSIHFIHAEKHERIRFQFFKVTEAGQFFFIMSLSLVIATAYFSRIEHASWEELVPRFRLGESTANIILKTASYWQPELGQLQTSQTSVDEYLIRLSEEKTLPAEPLPGEQPGGASETFGVEFSLVPGIEERLRQAGISFEDIAASPAIRDYYLQAGRLQLSELAGREVRGSDPITLVFSEVIQSRLIETFNGTDRINRLPVRAIPFALAVILFLTLLPLGSFLGYFWRAFGYIVFLFLLKTEQLEIVEHLDEVEELEVTD
ncbi:MAG: hypothetical protein A2808_00940 [Candidatus Moranbacteria bacterium RIFCSPHIGHO2_01_FULL_55_24]|nr:MAG: hypothetical protein A2808_00940 [Candidatus Moranbacteria bacterium RIFCSPHIGHO2_01_FULL_55_24]